MRLFRWMLVLATPAIAACSGVTEPPSGLPIDLTASVGAPVPGSVSIAGAADSVIATVVQGQTCGSTASAAAALRNGRLIVTLSFTAPKIACMAPGGSATYTMIVHSIPPGSYTATLHEWLRTNDNVPLDYLLETRAIALP